MAKGKWKQAFRQRKIRENDNKYVYYDVWTDIKPFSTMLVSVKKLNIYN